MYFYRLLFLVFLFGSFISCKKEVKKPSWDVDVTAPIVKTSLNFSDLLSDTLTTTNNDSSLSILYSYDIFNYKFDSVLNFLSEEFQFSAKLDNIEIEDQTITQNFTILDLTKDIDIVVIPPNTTPLSSILKFYHGNILPLPVSDMSNISVNDIEIDANKYFQTMTLNQGWLDFEFTNNLPVEIQNFTYSIKETENNTALINDNISTIASNASVSKSYDMAGKTISGKMIADLLNIDILSSGLNSTVIDTTDAIEIKITIRDIKPHSAVAIFPSQNIVEQENDIIIESDYQLTQAIVKKGKLVVNTYSPIQDSVRLFYKLPGALKDGKSFNAQVVIPPAEESKTVYRKYEYDLAGYDIDLSGKNGDTFNTLTQQIIAAIDSTGQLTYLNIEDSIYFDLGLKDVEATYIKGYIGNEVVSYDFDTTNINIFESVLDGKLDFENIDVNLKTINTIGADANVIIKKLSTFNSRTNETKDLTSSIISETKNIERATDLGNVIKQSELDISLTNSNSNITDLMNILPNKIAYSIDVEMNPSGNPTAFDNFIYDSSEIKTSLEMKIPLKITATNLTLADTIEYNPATSNEDTKINEGKFTLVANNGFPFEAKIDILMLNQHNNVFDTLALSRTIASGETNDKLIVTNPYESRTIITADSDKMYGLKYLTKKLLIIARFTTKPDNQHVTLYSDYNLSLKLIGDVNMKLEY